MKLNLLNIVGFLAMTCLLVTTVSCHRGKQTRTPEEDLQLRVPLVRTIEIQEASPLESHVVTGAAKEGKTVKQAFRVPGPIVEFNVEVGKRVKKGDVLAKLDPRDFELAVERVRKGLDEANAALRAMKTGARAEDVASLEAQVAAATSQYEIAEKNEQRFSTLLASGSASQAQYDQAKMARDSAKAAKEAAEKQLEKGKTGARSEEIEAMEAKIAGLHVTLQLAENALGDTVLKAPSDGYVSQKYVEEGEIIAAGIPVLAFTDVSQIQVQVTVPEALLIRQRDFTGFQCEFEIYPGRKFNAKLRELGQAMQAGKQGYPMEVEIEDTQDLDIHPGMAAVVTVQVKRQETPCTVPLAALVGDYDVQGDKTTDAADDPQFTGSTKTLVWQIGPDNKLVKKPVTVLRVMNENVEIAAGDLQPGSKIVGAGARFLREGQEVREQ